MVIAIYFVVSLERGFLLQCLGITMSIAGFMSGMAGNVSAFAAVWSDAIYRPLLRPQATDAEMPTVGRWSTVLGVLASVGTAYFAI